MTEPSKLPRQSSETNSLADGLEAVANDHFARFYLDDETLVESLAQYVTEGLRDGDAAVVIATEPHFRALERIWASIEFDTAE